jgi:2-methylaconitate cis-trans-isomerase PrpF
MCAGVAARITGTLVQESARMDVAGDTLRVGNGSGVLPVSASVSRRDDGWYAERVSVCRTVRVLMAGQVFAPDGEL